MATTLRAMPWSHALGVPGPPGSAPRVDRSEEDIGRQISSLVGVVDATRHEALHRPEVLAVERLQRVGVAADRGDDAVVLHACSLPQPPAALHEVVERAPRSSQRSSTSSMPTREPHQALGDRRRLGLPAPAPLERRLDAAEDGGVHPQPGLVREQVGGQRALASTIATIAPKPG